MILDLTISVEYVGIFSVAIGLHIFKSGGDKIRITNSVGSYEEYKIYPANLFMTTKESTLRAIHQIEDDLTKQVEYFEIIRKYNYGRSKTRLL